MTVASNICVYLIAMAFFGLGDSGTELSDQVCVEFRLTRKLVLFKSVTAQEKIN